MGVQEIEERFIVIEQHLEQKALMNAIKEMENLLLLDADWALSNELDQIKTSYHYMLQYLLQGIQDPQREKLHTKLIADAWKVADHLHHFLLMQHTNLQYIAVYRQCQGGNSLPHIISQLETFQDNLSVLQLTDNRSSSLEEEMKSHELWQEQLFNTVWTNYEWSQEELDAANGALHSELLLPADICLLLSAVGMSLLQSFDERKIQLAIDASLHTDAQIQVRAFTCLALALHRYAGRIPFYPELMNRFQLLKDDKDFCRGISLIFLQLLQAQDTHKVTRKIREEIMPDFIKNIQKFNHGLDAYEENDLNPEWGSMNPELDEKIRQMNELVMQGSDVYMSTFSMMKQFPFFHAMAHWFLPYYQQHSLVARVVGNQVNQMETIDLILRSSGICDNDKYSMLCVFPSIPDAQKQMILSKFSSGEAKEMIQENAKELEDYNKRLDVIARNYIQSLYRFFKLYVFHREFVDVFEESIEFYDNRMLNDYTHNAQSLHDVANYLFKSERYIDARHVYEILIEEDKAEVSDYQKAGFCLQKRGNYPAAIQHYLQADLMQPSNSWTLRHLATCYRLTGNYAQALGTYQKAAQLLPENRSIIYQMGVCLLEEKRYEEAMQKFFQLDLMESNSPKVWRAIGWCSFMLNKHQQAVNYFTKATAEAPQPHDWINLGHCYLVQGQLPQAIGYYRKARALMITDEEKYGTFASVFLKDSDVLKSKEIDAQLFPLIIDLTETEEGIL